MRGTVLRTGLRLGGLLLLLLALLTMAAVVIGYHLGLIAPESHSPLGQYTHWCTGFWACLFQDWGREIALIGSLLLAGTLLLIGSSILSTRK